MTSSLKHSLVVLTVALAGLAGCGGSSSSGGPGGPTGPTGPGATANLSLKGVITGASAAGIQVNGVTVSTGASTVTRIERVEKPESELKVGMVVKVKAHRGGAGREAEGLEIEFEDDVKGRVSGKDDAQGTITVGGQVVRVDDSTHFTDDGARLASVSVGQRVRVSGVADDRGGLRATRIDDDGGVSEDFEVKGVVSASSAGGFTLTTVDGTVFAVTLGAGVSAPADGAYVEARSAAAPVAGAFTAVSITLEDRLPGLPGIENEVEGIVTSGSSASFVINGTTVVPTVDATWAGGQPADLLPGMKVEAEGVLGADGVLAAHKVTFKEFIRLFGFASGTSASSATAGRLTVNGIDAVGDAATRWDTAADAIADGDWVELRGMVSREGPNVVYLSRIEVKSPGGNARPVVQGVVTAADATAGTVTILGQTIGTSGGTELRDHSDVSGVDGALMTPAAFFAAVTAGLELVKVTGQNNADWTAGATGQVARSMELEGER